jgi:hypothetical protein
VLSELGYGYFCGNIVDEYDAWVSSHCFSVVTLFGYYSMNFEYVFVDTYKML